MSEKLAGWVIVEKIHNTAEALETSLSSATSLGTKCAVSKQQHQWQKYVASREKICVLVNRQADIPTQKVAQ